MCISYTAVEEKQNGGRNSWQWEKYVWLYFDLLQALKGDALRALCCQQRGLCSTLGAVYDIISFLVTLMRL